MTAVPPDVVDVVLGRDGWACVVCGKPTYGLRGVDWSIHHRRPRGMGGTRRPDAASPANLLTLCGSGTAGCHGHVELHRADAFCNGWLLMQRSDPAVVPVLVDRMSLWVYLTHDGTYSTEPPTTNEYREERDGAHQDRQAVVLGRRQGEPTVP